MTIARLRETGRGRPSARLVIEGLGIEVVSSASMARTLSDGRLRVYGLRTSGLVIGADADLMHAEVQAKSLTITVDDMRSVRGSRFGRVTQHFTRAAQKKLFLASDISKVATTITLRSTVGLDASGVVHIGTEAILYDSISGSDLVDCTRGAWGTIAQAHFARDGEGLSDAVVSEAPRGLEGRRAYLYVYGDGDDMQGDGTLRWRGVVATEPTWDAGVVTFGLDPPTRVLAQSIGTGGAQVGVRGVKYSAASPFVITVAHYPDAAEEVRSTVELTGFWETNDAFAASVNEALAEALATASIDLGTDASLTARARGESLEIVYITTLSFTAPIIAVYINDGYIHAVQRTSSTTAPTTGPTAWSDGTGLPVLTFGDRTSYPHAVTRYHFIIPAPVPRGTLGVHAAWDPYHRPPTAGFETLERLLPLGGLAVPTESSVLLPMGTEWGEDPRPLRVYSASGRDAYILTDRNIVPYNALTSFEIGMHIVTGSVVDLVTQLVVQSPHLANTGSMPLLSSDDIVPTSELDAAASSSPLASARSFYVFGSAKTLGELVTPELRVLGAYQRIGLTGSIEWDRLRPPLATDPVTWTITNSSTKPRLVKAPFGTLGRIVYKMNYDPKEDEHGKRTVTFQDVQNTSATRVNVVVEWAQLSTSGGFFSEADDWTTVDRTELRRAATAVFGLFGTPVIVAIVEVDSRYMDARIGEAASLSLSLLPDPSDGLSSISSRAGMIVSHALDFSTGKVTLGVLMHTESFVGYHLGVPISAQTNTSGDTWSIDLSLTDYLDAPEGSPNIARVLSVGDLVEITEGDSATPTTITGTVSALTDANTVVVELASSWTPASAEWWLRVPVADNYERGVGLGRYAWVADQEHLIEYSGGESEGQVFA